MFKSLLLHHQGVTTPAVQLPRLRVQCGCAAVWALTPARASAAARAAAGKPRQPRYRHCRWYECSPLCVLVRCAFACGWRCTHSITYSTAAATHSAGMQRCCMLRHLLKHLLKPTCCCSTARHKKGSMGRGRQVRGKQGSCCCTAVLLCLAPLPGTHQHMHQAFCWLLCKVICDYCCSIADLAGCRQCKGTAGQQQVAEWLGW